MDFDAQSMSKVIPGRTPVHHKRSDSPETLESKQQHASSRTTHPPGQRILQDRPIYQDVGVQTWPEEVELQEKLWGLAVALRKAADFIFRTGLSIWAWLGNAEEKVSYLVFWAQSAARDYIRAERRRRRWRRRRCESPTHSSCHKSVFIGREMEQNEVDCYLFLFLASIF